MITAPAKFQRKFRYTNKISRGMTLGSTLTYLNIPFNINSCYQFDQSAIGPEPIPGFQEFSGLYQKCKVKGVKIKIKFSPSTTAAGVPNVDNIHMAFIALPEGNAIITSWTNIEGYIANNPRHVMQTFVTPTNTSGRWLRMSKYYKIKDYFTSGTSYDALETTMMGINQGGILAGNPARIVQGQLSFLSQNSGGLVASASISFIVEVVFYVEFYQTRLQAN